MIRSARPSRIASLLAGVTLVAACSSGTDPDRTARARDVPSAARPPTTTTTVVDSPDDLPAPSSASALAETFTRVERSLRAASTPADEIDRLGWEQQLAYRTLSNHPEWEAEVLGVLPADVQPVVASILEAGRSLTTLVEPQAALPDWRIEAPPPPEVLVGYYREAEAASGVPWPYLAAIDFVETRHGPDPRHEHRGRAGPDAVHPSDVGRVRCGRHQRQSRRDPRRRPVPRRRRRPDDMARALFSYNNSDDYVDSVQRYADLISSGQELVYRGFYHWQVHYATTQGLALLPEGYPTTPAVYLTPG